LWEAGRAGPFRPYPRSLRSPISPFTNYGVGPMVFEEECRAKEPAEEGSPWKGRVHAELEVVFLGRH